MECQCYRCDADDPLGQIPSSVKLEQLEAIFLVYQFLVWRQGKNPEHESAVRDKICESTGWTREQFEACVDDAQRMLEGFHRATDHYVRESIAAKRIVVAQCH